jgi:hypothetical protein
LWPICGPQKAGPFCINASALTRPVQCRRSRRKSKHSRSTRPSRAHFHSSTCD